MTAVTIRVASQTARVRAQSVQPVTVTPADGARVAVIAKPGPPGPAGELDPADMTQITDDAATAVLEDLEPPVTLTLLFENGLAG